MIDLPLLPSLFCQGFKIEVNCKQLTVDFVNQSVLQISSQDVESKRSDKTDFAEQLGAMNRRWQILQGLITEKVRKRPAAFQHWFKNRCNSFRSRRIKSNLACPEYYEHLLWQNKMSSVDITASVFLETCHFFPNSTIDPAVLHLS